jgi:hypothetical protein
MTPRYTMTNCLGNERKAASAKTQIVMPENPRIRNTTNQNDHRFRTHTTDAEDCSREMARDDAKSSDQSNF